MKIKSIKKVELAEPKQYYDVIEAPSEFRMLNRIMNKLFSNVNGGNSNGL